MEFNTKDPKLQAFLKGAEEREVKDYGQWYTNIERTINAYASPATKGTVVFADEDSTVLKIGTGRPVLVRDEFSNVDYKCVTGAASPSKGKFSVNAATGTLTFNKEDAEKNRVY